MEFQEVVEFHGHVCPGLAMGYRVAKFAAKKLQFERAGDEELVAIVENNSCAVDAIQMVLGCTFGKGNFIFKDYGKQVYTFFKRSDNQSIRVAIKWLPPSETEEISQMWKRFRQGDRSSEVVSAITASKGKKAKTILEAADEDLFAVSEPIEMLPEKAQIYPTVTCDICKEKCMEPKSVVSDDGLRRCIPCSSSKE